MEAEGAAEAQARIYIGGLGESVTADDLRKILSAVGDVRDVDIIRTKGRSFAYVEFRPSSLNSIPKLFSTYNGCAWKGGRLRLEKAKEHYLDRLRLEKEEAAQPEPDLGDREEAVVEPLEKKHLRIFFPRLRKGKSLPLSGTGKHRYSFPRVEPPLLQLHFCDCQEHSAPFDTVVAKRNDHQKEDEVVIDDAEINIMNSVMNRLFGSEQIVHDTAGHNSYSSIQNQVLHHKADVGSICSNMMSAAESISASSGSNRNKRLRGAQTYGEGSTQLLSGTLENGVLSHSKKKKLHVVEQGNRKEAESVMPGEKGDPHHDDEGKQESEESETDEDGLVLNVLPAANNRFGLSRTNKNDSASFNLEPSQDVHKEHMKNILPPKMKKSPFNNERDGSEFMSVSSENNRDVENHASGPAQSLKESDVRRSWSQKSSWKALVGDKGRNAFSLSSILPNSDANNRDQGL